MKEVTTKYFLFSELSDEAKKKAIKNNSEICFYYGWDRNIIEEEQARLEELGFSNVEILYSGFYSQGDGACFTGELDNDGLIKFMCGVDEKGVKLVDKYRAVYDSICGREEHNIHVNIKITHSGHYYHEYMTSTNDYSELQTGEEMTGDLLKEWQAFMTFFDNRVYELGNNPLTGSSRHGWLIDCNRAIYKALENENDYLGSDESIIEYFENNEVYFTSEGEIE
jgi:hypothetical protein